MLELVLFFFSSSRRHTSCYRDWSSDVCSSDLVVSRPRARHNPLAPLATLAARRFQLSVRSEERRVGKECRSRWSRLHEKKKTKHDIEVELREGIDDSKM